MKYIINCNWCLYGMLVIRLLDKTGKVIYVMSNHKKFTFKMT